MLAALLLVCASLTVIAAVISIAIEKDGMRRIFTLAFSALYAVVMILAAISLMHG